MSDYIYMPKEDWEAALNSTREKTGSTALIKSGELAAAISGITAGGDLSLTIVGGTVQPSSPAENTVWVNTSTDIAGWRFTPYEPSEPIEGMVWIQSATYAPNDINLSESNLLEVFPHTVYQYVSGVWVKQEAYLYEGAAWTEITGELIILEDGVLVDDYSALGRVYGTGGANGYVKFEGDMIEVYAPAVTNSINNCYLKNPIDLSRYETLEMDVAVKGWNGGWYGFHSDPENCGISSTDYLTGWAVVGRPTTASNTVWSGTVALDLTGVTEKSYLMFGCAGSQSSGYTAYFGVTRIKLS